MEILLKVLSHFAPAVYLSLTVTSNLGPQDGDCM